MNSEGDTMYGLTTTKAELNKLCLGELAIARLQLTKAMNGSSSEDRTVLRSLLSVVRERQALLRA